MTLKAHGAPNGCKPFRLELLSAERRSGGISRALFFVKTRGSRSSALLWRVTRPEHRRVRFCFVIR